MISSDQDLLTIHLFEGIDFVCIREFAVQQFKNDQGAIIHFLVSLQPDPDLAYT